MPKYTVSIIYKRTFTGKKQSCIDTVIKMVSEGRIPGITRVFKHKSNKSKSNVSKAKRKSR